MTGCREMEERLNDYLDGLLDQAERRAVDRHLAGCPGCQEALASLRALQAGAGALPRSLEPERDLWREIEAGLKPAGQILRPRFPWLAAGRPGAWAAGLAAAAAAAVIAVVVFTGRPGPTGPASPGISGDGAAVPAVAGTEVMDSFRAAEMEYLQAVEMLLATLESRREELSPETRAVIEENLRIINDSISKLWEALESEPDRPGAGHRLVELYRKKLSLLERTVRLAPGTESSGRREEST
jgi:anti-sigma factor RsiW